MATRTEFAMLHPALANPRLWAVSQGRGKRELAVAFKGKKESRNVRVERTLLPQIAAPLDVTSEVNGIIYRFVGPHPLTQSDLSYMLALIGNARPVDNWPRLRVDLAGKSLARNFLLGQHPTLPRQAVLYGVETNYPTIERQNRTHAPQTCMAEDLLRDAGKAPDRAERLSFWAFVQKGAAVTVTVTDTTKRTVLGGIPLLMYRATFDEQCLEIWHNPFQSRLLEGGNGPDAMFRRISLVERNQIDGDLAKLVHLVLSARVQQDKPMRMGWDTLMDLLWEPPPNTNTRRQELYRRRQRLMVAIGKLVNAGWKIADQGHLLVISRPRVTRAEK